MSTDIAEKAERFTILVGCWEWRRIDSLILLRFNEEVSTFKDINNSI